LRFDHQFPVTLAHFDQKDPDFHFTPVGIREELSLLFPNDIGGKKRKAEETLILHKGVKNETSISSNTVKSPFVKN
jgi:hypothetical protein